MAGNVFSLGNVPAHGASSLGEVEKNRPSEQSTVTTSRTPTHDASTMNALGFGGERAQKRYLKMFVGGGKRVVAPTKGAQQQVAGKAGSKAGEAGAVLLGEQIEKWGERGLTVWPVQTKLLAVAMVVAGRATKGLAPMFGEAAAQVSEKVAGKVSDRISRPSSGSEPPPPKKK